MTTINIKGMGFPCFKRGVDSELVVLFFSENSGVVINCGRFEWLNDAYFGTTWASCKDNEAWQDIEMEATFTNKGEK